ncbi:MAG: hypothetical protein AAB664_00840 [Patescibacteria group bacterium]
MTPGFSKVNIGVEDVVKVLCALSLRHQVNSEVECILIGMRSEHGSYRVSLIPDGFRVNMIAYLDCYLDRDKHSSLLWKMLEANKGTFAVFAIDGDDEVLFLRKLEYPTAFDSEHFACALAVFFKEAEKSLFLLRKGMYASEEVND